MIVPAVKDSIDLLRDNWRKNHRHHGAFAASRCLAGILRLVAMPRRPQSRPGDGVDCVTFSVVPNLTALWARLMAQAIPGGNARIWVGDSSGGFKTEHVADLPVSAYPLVNYLHGFKLDIFFEKFIRSELFVVSDDDIFWLDEEPWRWARNEFSKDPRTAVASLLPRRRFKWELGGREHQPMGSYCLVIRRDIWLKEKLSFQAVPEPSPSTASYAGHYDTCDFANVALIERGYRVAIAPPHITDHLAAFNGVSSAVLRIQKDPPEGHGRVYWEGPVPIVESCLVTKQLSKILGSISPRLKNTHLVDPELAEKAERELRPFLEEGQYEELQLKVGALAERIAASLGSKALAALATAG